VGSAAVGTVATAVGRLGERLRSSFDRPLCSGGIGRGSHETSVAVQPGARLPPVSSEIRALIRLMARANPLWGPTNSRRAPEAELEARDGRSDSRDKRGTMRCSSGRSRVALGWRTCPGNTGAACSRRPEWPPFRNLRSQRSQVRILPGAPLFSGLGDKRGTIRSGSPANHSQLAATFPNPGHRFPQFLVRDVEVALSLLNVGVTEHQLDDADVYAVRQ
jgi:hypothetical protein